MSDDIPQDQVEAVSRALCAAHCHSIRAVGDKLVFGPGCDCFAWELLKPDAIAAIRVLTPMIAAVERLKLNAWMIRNSVATGHGDTIEDLLLELDRHIDMMDADFSHAVAVERERCAALVETSAWRCINGSDPKTVKRAIAAQIRSVKGAVT